VHRRAGLDVAANEPGERRCCGVADDGHTGAATTRAAHLNTHHYKGFLAAGTSTARAGLEPADEALVGLDRTDQRRAFGVDHRPTQLVQHQSRGLLGRSVCPEH